MKLSNSQEASARRVSGTTLVEVMVAILLLGLMATGAATFMYQSRAQIVFQENRRVALEVANARLEELRASPYVDVQPPGQDFNVYYLFKQSGFWFHANVDPQRTINVNGRMLPITTAVQYIDADGGIVSYDLLKIRVEVAYRQGADERVVLESFYSQ